jgi:type I restriction enzyme S subunit
MKKVKLSSISEIQAGPFGTQLHASDYVCNGVPMINAKNIGHGSLIYDSVETVSTETCNKLSKYLLNAGDIVFGRAGSIDKHVYIENDFAGWFQGTNCIRIRCRNPRYAKYISYYLWLPEVKKQISNQAGGSILKYLNTDLLKEIDIPIVEEKKAEQIVKVLDMLDQKIRLNKRIIAELEDIAKTIYDYWFVQFDFPNAEGKPYRSSGGEMAWSHHLKREIPKGWRDTTLSSFIKAEKGGDWGKEQKTGNYTEKVICIRGADFSGLIGKQLLNAPTRYILKKNLNKALSDGDIIVEISGGSPTQSTGRVSYINEQMLSRFDIPIITSNFCKAFTLINQNWQYWFYILWEKLYNAGLFFKYEGKTTGIKNLLFDMLCSDYRTIYPDEHIASQYNDLVKPFFVDIQKRNLENLELTKIRDWLLPMLMNGQVTVQNESAGRRLQYQPVKDEMLKVAEEEEDFNSAGH